MESARERNLILGRLDDGEDIFDGILRVMEEEGARCGVLLGGVGMLKEVTLCYFDGSRYIERQHPKPMEIVSLGGNVSLEGALHVHCSLADRDYRVVGGHLHGGRVANVVEFQMAALEDVGLKRDYVDAARTRLRFVR
ncbi:MAG: DNA-binding protein [Thermoplasmata archaeon]|nr:DNA-binding protein [Thermoplasmata archaeon]